MPASCGAEGLWLLHFSQVDTCRAYVRDMVLTLSRDGGALCASMDTLRFGFQSSPAYVASSAIGCQLSLEVMGDGPSSATDYSAVRLPIVLGFDGGSRIATRVDYAQTGAPSCSEAAVPLIAYRGTVPPASNIGTACDAGPCPAGLACYEATCALAGWLDAGEGCVRSPQCQPTLSCRVDAGARVCQP